MRLKARRSDGVGRVFVAILLTLTLVGCSRGPRQEQAQYYCPMHPQVVSDQPGDCPVCGMRLVPRKAAAPADETAHAVYTCPMHPEIAADRPGDCPICGMHLVPRAEAPAPTPGDHATAAVYVCPMHPAVTSDHPGSCSICGMALVARDAGPEPPSAGHAAYTCPMHPEIAAVHPGDCPICGMHLVPRDKAPAADAADHARTAVYTCPMHPGVTSPGPGSCPKCGMELVPRKDAAAGPPPGLAAVDVPAAKRELLGMTTGRVAIHRFVRHIRAAARITPDEGRLFRITAPVAGWVDRLYVQGEGDVVHVGEPLARLYNVDALRDLRSDLYYLGQGDSTQPMPDPNLVLARRFDQTQLAYPQSLLATPLLLQRVQRWGFSQEQIRTYSKDPVKLNDLFVYATASGSVAEKSVIPGQSVQAGDQLMVVADLSRVWADVDLLASDSPYVPVGADVEIEAPALAGRVFPGRLTAVAPFLDPETRTQRVRVELKNPGELLRPGLPAVAMLTADIGEHLAVPAGAILRTGRQTYAFRLDAGDRIEPVTVQTGISDDGFVQVLAGLAAGDRVVTSATFLIDSESAMAGALQAVSGR